MSASVPYGVGVDSAASSAALSASTSTRAYSRDATSMQRARTSAARSGAEVSMCSSTACTSVPNDFPPGSPFISEGATAVAAAGGSGPVSSPGSSPETGMIRLARRRCAGRWPAGSTGCRRCGAHPQSSCRSNRATASARLRLVGSGDQTSPAGFGGDRLDGDQPAGGPGPVGEQAGQCRVIGDRGLLIRLRLAGVAPEQQPVQRRGGGVVFRWRPPHDEAALRAGGGHIEQAQFLACLLGLMVSLAARGSAGPACRPRRGCVGRFRAMTALRGCRVRGRSQA